jgi:hypothetical protein
MADVKASENSPTETIMGKSKAVAGIIASSNSKLIITLLIAGIALAFITGYVLYYIINKTLSKRLGYLIPETSIPILATQESVFAADLVPNSGNGKRASLNFWIYIYDINKFSGTNRHVLHRGGEGDTIGTASPYIHIDPNSNKLYVTFSDGSSLPTSMNGATQSEKIYIEMQ